MRRFRAVPLASSTIKGASATAPKAAMGAATGRPWALMGATGADARGVEDTEVRCSRRRLRLAALDPSCSLRTALGGMPLVLEDAPPIAVPSAPRRTASSTASTATASKENVFRHNQTARLERHAAAKILDAALRVSNPRRGSWGGRWRGVRQSGAIAQNTRRDGREIPGAPGFTHRPTILGIPRRATIGSGMLGTSGHAEGEPRKRMPTPLEPTKLCGSTVVQRTTKARARQADRKPFSIRTAQRTPHEVATSIAHMPPFPPGQSQRRPLRRHKRPNAEWPSPRTVGELFGANA